MKDAHDRHANFEIGHLPQCMQPYDGLAILTINLQQNLDPAFRSALEVRERPATLRLP